MAKTNVKCKNCNKNFKAENKELNRGNGKFCSNTCSTTYHAKKKQIHNTICAWCNKEFYRMPSKKKKSTSKSGLYFCCSEHKNKAQRSIDGLDEFQLPHYTNGSGAYRNAALREFGHNCNRCNYNKEIKILAVHHKDKDRSNNSLENLEVLCQNCHTEEHLKDRKLSKLRKVKYKIEWPEINKLKDMVNKSSYVAVSKKLGVSDTAIKKHIWKYDSNFKSK